MYLLNHPFMRGSARYSSSLGIYTTPWSWHPQARTASLHYIRQSTYSSHIEHKEGEREGDTHKASKANLHSATNFQSSSSAAEPPSSAAKHRSGHPRTHSPWAHNNTHHRGTSDYTCDPWRRSDLKNASQGSHHRHRPTNFRIHSS
jgi:hypothetical protein